MTAEEWDERVLAVDGDLAVAQVTDPLAYEATDPADAYGLALLDLIEEAETYLRVLVDEL